MRKNLEKSLSDFMGEVILRQLSLHHVRTAETYASTLRSFMRFRQGHDCLLTDLTPDLIQRYEAWLYDSGVVPNTASFYLKRLRAAYNKAVAQGLVDQQYPFREVYTSKAKTVKRAISKGLLRKISTSPPSPLWPLRATSSSSVIIPEACLLSTWPTSGSPICAMVS